MPPIFHIGEAGPKAEGGRSGREWRLPLDAVVVVASVDVVVVSEVKSVWSVSWSGTVVSTVGMVGSGGNVDGSVASAVVSGTSVGSSVGLSVGSSVGFSVGSSQVWSLTQFYSVDFSKSRIGVNKCVFNKCTIKVCVSCS